MTGTPDASDQIDRWDRRFAVLHLPGHSPGGIGLLADLSALSVPGCLLTLEQLLGIDFRLATGWHGPEISRPRLISIAKDCLRRRG